MPNAELWFVLCAFSCRALVCGHVWWGKVERHFAFTSALWFGPFSALLAWFQQNATCVGGAWCSKTIAGLAQWTSPLLSWLSSIQNVKFKTLPSTLKLWCYSSQLYAGLSKSSWRACSWKDRHGGDKVVFLHWVFAWATDKAIIFVLVEYDVYPWTTVKNTEGVTEGSLQVPLSH